MVLQMVRTDIQGSFPRLAASIRYLPDRRHFLSRGCRRYRGGAVLRRMAQADSIISIQYGCGGRRARERESRPWS